jgi:hypothetical protein
MVLQAGANGADPRGTAHISGLLSGIITLIGIVAGIIALCGIPRHGRKGLLLPALTGLGLYLLMFLLAIPVFLNVRAKAKALALAAQNPTVLQPARHTEGAKRFEDAGLGLSFDIPDGFQPMDFHNLPPQYKYGFIKPGEGGFNSVVMVQPLGAKLGRGEQLQTTDLPKALQEKGVTVATLNWRGIQVDAFRVPEKSNDQPYINLNVQIPIREAAVQLCFGGPAGKAPEIRARAEQVLASLEGESNW